MNGSKSDGPIELERALLTTDVRSDAQRLEALLHPEFVEFGLSGRRYDRNDVIELLPALVTTSPTIIEIEQHDVAPGVALVVFTTDESASGDAERPSGARRCSLWVADGPGKTWRLRYHQASPA